MKPQSDAFLEKAWDVIERAETMLRAGLNEDAGRAAYLAGFHAAQAALFEKDDKVFKTHTGVHGKFGRLAKADRRYDLELRAFLGRTYNFKNIADYEIGPGAHVTAEEAAKAVTAAKSFVTRLAALLGEGPT